MSTFNFPSNLIALILQRTESGLGEVQEPPKLTHLAVVKGRSITQLPPPHPKGGS